jgi:predicted hydrocarbon binding protein
MNEEAKKAMEEYRALAEKLGIKEKPFTNEEGKIIFLGKRWVMLDVDYFPEFMIQVTEQVVGPIAKEFIYWFGYAYGEKVAERQIEMEVPKEYIIPSLFASAALFAGWSITKIDEMDLEKGYLKAHSYNNFETESAEKIGRKSEVKFSRGVIDGIFSVLINAKVQSKLKMENDTVIVEVTKR